MDVEPEARIIRNQLGYLLAYLGATKQYVTADVIGSGKIDQKTKDTLDRINKYVHEKALEIGPSGVEDTRRILEHGLWKRTVELRDEVYSLRLKLSGARVDKTLIEKVGRIYHGLDNCLNREHYFFNRNTKEQIGTMEDLYKAAQLAKDSLKDLDKLKEEHEAEKKSTLEKIRKFGVVGIIVFFGILMAFSLIPSETTGNFIFSPTLSLLGVVFSIGILSILYLSFK